jgi:oligopeptide/dipeptide ABC transporter ATP-binding protein
MTAVSIMQLIPRAARIIGGSILFEGEDLCKRTEKELSRVRGRGISMVFQNPVTSLNPVMTVGDHLRRIYMLRRNCGREEADKKSVEILTLVGIPDADRRMRSYAHELSGGMCQRVVIGMMMMACQPELLIADEPTTNLDVTIEAQILDLMRDLKARTGTGILLITHDLGIIAEMCERVAIMHAGRVVEYADVRAIFREPLHPYSVALLNCVRRVDRKSKIAGIPPGTLDLTHAPQGCRFFSRCTVAMDKCKEIRPALVEARPGHFVMCHLPNSDCTWTT